MITRWKVTTLERGSIQMRGRYDKCYKKNTIVKANKGSLGIMVFKTQKQAEHWSNTNFQGTSKVLKVLPKGRGKVPKLISTPFSINSFYRCLTKLLKEKGMQNPTLYGRGKYTYMDGNIAVDLWPVPPGTICYPAVKVLT